jgi:FKBP-type peptidyl-prolyl cis-trans isomerase FkpA
MVKDADDTVGVFMRYAMLLLAFGLMSCSSNNSNSTNAPDDAASRAYLEKAASEPGAVKTSSGLIYKELRQGNGPSPKPTDVVTVNYRGTLVNGTEFDSSYKRGEPASFPLNRVIPCWTEGLQKMKEGGKSQLVCPGAIAYGEAGSPPVIPPNATLIFEVELIKIGG